MFGNIGYVSLREMRSKKGRRTMSRANQAGLGRTGTRLIRAAVEAGLGVRGGGPVGARLGATDAATVGTCGGAGVGAPLQVLERLPATNQGACHAEGACDRGIPGGVGVHPN